MPGLPSTEDVPAPGAARRVLLVEDNEDSAELLAVCFARFGWHVETFTDGASALERAASFRPDIALINLALPRMDGWEVATRMKSIPTLNSVPLIAVTGFSGEGYRLRSETAGFALHLVKPVVVQELTEHIMRLCP
jgi:CheY-like chemotaxis protein